jgi:hypothetical protein
LIGAQIFTIGHFIQIISLTQKSQLKCEIFANPLSNFPESITAREFIIYFMNFISVLDTRKRFMHIKWPQN